MANPNFTPTSKPAPTVPEPKKSNLWLIIIIIIVLLALLWPVLRRDKASTSPTIDDEGTATTSEETSNLEDISLDPSDLPSSAVSPSSGISNLSAVSVAPIPTTLTLKVFFGNQQGNPAAWQCGTVSAVTRTVANTSAVARASLSELLNGLRSTDSSAGFFTALNSGVKIKQLTIDNGVARVDFDRALITGAGANTSCLKEGARAQITETLKQFSTVRSVIISINGVLF